MQRRSAIGVWCDRVMEAGWLLAVTLVPIYFNLLSARHFEPDKATSLRAIVLVMLAAWVIRTLDGLSHQPATRSEAENSPTNPLRAAWKRFASVPLAVPALIYVLVFLLTTFTSIVPRTSFFGSYQRLQGTYTNLSYVLLFAMIVAAMRRREQLERLLTVTLLTSSVVAGYGLLQHFQLDPLPWRGDVITRVASTMGNSIFVAAYMILVVPFALYRLVDTLNQARRAEAGDSGSDIAWIVSYILLIAGCLALLLGVIKFAAAVRTADFRYWWVFPGALMICAWLFAVPTLHLRQRQGMPASAIFPAFLLLGYGVFLALIYQFSSSSGVQAVDPNAVNAQDWGWWMAGGILLVLGFFGLAATLPRSEDPPSRLNLYSQAVGVLLLLLALLAAIFFTQSRGPWLGLFAGLFVFFTLLVWFAMLRAREVSPQLHRTLRALLVAELVLALAIGGFLLAFNFSNAPFFAQLRDVPYVGRMGRLLETDEGTGLVRVLIWRGDDKAGGAVALIMSDPLRALVGWGPESMFVAYNKFYPPALANIEARGASPDRSHQAILDELVTKGFLGLVSYLFVLVSFFVLAWRLIRKSSEWHWQVLFIAAIAVVISHFVESFVGIPIVATLMMLWVTLGITVTGGAMAGVYQLGAEERVAQPVALAEPVRPTSGKRKPPQRGSNRNAPARGAAARPQSSGGAAAWLVYAIIIVLTLGAVWIFNFNVVYADMRFQQGQAFSSAGDPNQQLVAFSRYLDAIRLDPDEDFYYLNFGRTLMTLADIKRQQSPDLGQPLEDASINDLLRRSDAEAQTFIMSKAPMEVLSYAEATLERARALNSRNKDHYANLARLNNFWYTLTGDQQRLYRAEEWYRQAADIAPQDVVIKAEWAGALIALGNYPEAEKVLARSKELDAKYIDTDVRQADLLRAQGKLAEAVTVYTTIIAQNAHQLDAQIQQIIQQVEGQPELMQKLHDAYATAAAANPGDDALQNVFGLVAVRSGNLASAAEAYNRAVLAQPSNLQYRRNYALVLSDTNQLSEALDQARAAVDLARQQQGPNAEAEASALQGLVQFLEAQVAAGG